MRVGLKTAIPKLAMLTPGGGSIRLHAAMVLVDVDFDYKPATPDNDDGPGDMAQVKVTAILLHEPLALHDETDTMTLVLSRGADLLPHLPSHMTEVIGEKVLHVVLREEGRKG